MTMSTAFKDQVREAIQGKSGALGFLKNFKNTQDDANDTGAALATKMFADTRTLAASASENLDLAGALVGVDGAACVFTTIHGIYVKAAAANTNSVVVGGHASAAFVGWFGDVTDTVAVKPGEVFSITNDAGWAVTATTADLIKVLNSAGTTGVTYDIVIYGT